MKSKIEELQKQLGDIKIETVEQLEVFRQEYLSKKGKIQALFADFKNVPKEEKPEVGQLVNVLKNNAQNLYNDLKVNMGNSSSKEEKKLDLTRPVEFSHIGARHPISMVRKEIIDIFNRIGFVISEGPEVEDDFHIFTALNFPKEHPARDMQDTFFIEKDPDVALRTHTSSVQARVMESQKPPIRTISPGRVFRNEAISARAHCIFHQVEGLYVDKNVSFADLKQTLLYFAKEMFGEETKIRLRPSYFPFTEPSAEVDVSCNICGGKGCNVCKYTGWLEILGCGMVDPNVLTNCGIDSDEYTGFAFGMGVERIAMLKYQVKDLRYFFENDKRFLDQFTGAY
ncbi:MAG: phenylalanine--tRNA ligase subunit alpha [Bacteroidetes bacterium 4572_112]|nr:MAG: phenylalanine--tRNA ligase subunit alpha [Bacteroidetes bacterium 4572_112]